MTAMEDEFDVVAAWTQEAVDALGPGHAVAAGCRGSGSPSSLAWLVEALELTREDRFLDAGAGVGGPAGWLGTRYGLHPVCAEPMPAAARAAGRLFGLPSVVAWAEQLPFAASSFDAAWCLGVLCTTTEKAALLTELRRVLTVDGRLGLLVFVADALPVPDPPEGNAFPTEDELTALLSDAGFLVVQVIDTGSLPATPLSWQVRVDRVEETIKDRHGDEAAWQTAQEQSGRMGTLLREGHVRGVLVHAVAAELTE